MIVLRLIFLLSITGLAATLFWPAARDGLLLFGPMALAALWLLRRAKPAKRKPDPAGYVVIDGSNVMHWQNSDPALPPLRQVVRQVKARGLVPCVVFDANAGYKLGKGYRHDADMARLLNLPEKQVLVVPKGTPADEHILAAARSMGARVVSNDRFRDWQANYPEVTRPGHVIRGGMREGKVWLDLK